jgi:hypothetical protein
MNKMCVIKWFLCAFWIGYPSTRLIIRYSKEQKKKAMQ